MIVVVVRRLADRVRLGVRTAAVIAVAVVRRGQRLRTCEVKTNEQEPLPADSIRLHKVAPEPLTVTLPVGIAPVPVTSTLTDHGLTDCGGIRTVRGEYLVSDSGEPAPPQRPGRGAAPAGRPAATPVICPVSSLPPVRRQSPPQQASARRVVLPVPSFC